MFNFIFAFLEVSTQVKIFIYATNKIIISTFYGAELLKQAWTSTYKSYTPTKTISKSFDLTRKIKWSQADFNR